MNSATQRGLLLSAAGCLIASLAIGAAVGAIVYVSQIQEDEEEVAEPPPAVEVETERTASPMEPLRPRDAPPEPRTGEGPVFGGPFGPGQRWTGQMQCGQGPAELEFRVNLAGTEWVTGELRIVEYRSAPPNGRRALRMVHRMEGPIDGRRVTIDYSGWSVRGPEEPTRYRLEGTLDGAQRTLTGTTTRPDCTTFQLTRER